MIKGKEKVGEALYNAKFFCNAQYGWEVYQEYIDMFTFNLFGDPSLLLEGAYENTPPNKPTISGPTKGKPGESYDYTFSTIDPDGDDVYYWIEWFEGCPSVYWDGPHSSGAEIVKSNTWENRGTYIITVKAKDEHGAESIWSDPLTISMPKNRILNSNPLLLQFLEHHPYLFPILRFLLNLT